MLQEDTITDLQKLENW